MRSEPAKFIMEALSFLGTVLVVEDDWLIAIDLERILARHGCNRVDIVSSCKEAVKRSTQDKYDLVTVDVKLSDGNCDELVRSLEERAIPYIFVTGYDRGAYPAGKGPWISKPVADEDLVAVIQARMEAGHDFRIKAEPEPSHAES